MHLDANYSSEPLKGFKHLNFPPRSTIATTSDCFEIQPNSEKITRCRFESSPPATPSPPHFQLPHGLLWKLTFHLESICHKAVSLPVNPPPTHTHGSQKRIKVKLLSWLWNSFQWQQRSFPQYPSLRETSKENEQLQFRGSGLWFDSWWCAAPTAYRIVHIKTQGALSVGR